MVGLTYIGNSDIFFRSFQSASFEKRFAVPPWASFRVQSGIANQGGWWAMVRYPRRRSMSHISRRKQLRRSTANKLGLSIHELEWRKGVLHLASDGKSATKGIPGVPEVPKPTAKKAE